MSLDRRQESGIVQPALMPGRGSKNRQSSGHENGVISAMSNLQRSTLSPDDNVRAE